MKTAFSGEGWRNRCRCLARLLCSSHVLFVRHRGHHVLHSIMCCTALVRPKGRWSLTRMSGSLNYKGCMLRARVACHTQIPPRSRKLP